MYSKEVRINIIMTSNIHQLNTVIKFKYGEYINVWIQRIQISLHAPSNDFVYTIRIIIHN